MTASLLPHEWPDDEHDRFIRLAQTLDTLTELCAAFPHRSAQEVMDKAEAMGCLAMLAHGDYLELGRERLASRMSIDDAHEAWMATFDA